jgi:serine/threonine-protein kinase RsbW
VAKAIFMPDFFGDRRGMRELMSVELFAASAALPRPSPTVCENIILGVNEALANCVEHAYRAQDVAGTMSLQAGYDPDAQTIRVCVSDRGTWHRRSPRPPHDPHASRGIMLMHALADHCTISARPDGTTVCLDYSASQYH